MTSQSPQPNGANRGKLLPAGASQHVTPGPYSPVLEVEAARLVVISGQVALDAEGEIVGTSIEEQTRVTLENCRRLLTMAGCTLADVFKVNAYMVDLDDWDRFNAVYIEMIPEPRPARTTVGARLLPRLLIEIEMWAVKST